METERVKHYAQNQEMKVLDLEHALKEAEISLKHARQSKKDMAEKLAKTEKEYARF